MHPLTLVLMALGGCKSARPAAAVEEAKASPETIVAGPRNIVETPPPPIDPDIPGQGNTVAYLLVIRKAVMPTFQTCLSPLNVPQDTRPALVLATVRADGAVLVADLKQASGHDGVDACALEAVRTAVLQPPPADSLNEEGVLLTPELAFLPEG